MKAYVRGNELLWQGFLIHDLSILTHESHLFWHFLAERYYAAPADISAKLAVSESYFAACIHWSKLPAGTNRLKTEVSALNCLQPPQTFMLYSGDSIISKYRNPTKHTKLSKEQDFFHVYRGSRKAATAG